jgi:hypothetical protein
MIDNIVKDVLTFDFTSYMGLYLYWAPMSLCAYGYLVRTWVNYQADVKQRSLASVLHVGGTEGTRTITPSYHPTDTVGTLIGRVIVTVTPVVNLWSAAFDIAPKVFGTLFDTIEKIFNQPLVPRNKA